VGEIGVEWTTEREVRSIVGERAVDRAVGAGDVLIGQTGHELLQITNALSATSGVTITVVVVVLHIKSLLEASPLILGEKTAKVGLSNVAVLVSANRLHGVSVVGGQLEVRWAVSLETLGRVGKVSWDISKKVEIAKLGNWVQVVGEARVVRSKSVVLGTALWNHDNVKERAVAECLERRLRGRLETSTEEAKSPVDLRILDTGLSSGPEYGLRPSGSVGSCGIVGDLAG